MAFTASPSRTVQVLANSRAFSAGDFWNLTDQKKPKGVKDSNATVDFSFDWAAWLLDCADAIASFEFIFTGGLISTGEARNGTICTVFVAGGTGGQATITCRISTASAPARVEDRTVVLTIEDR